MAKKAQKRSKVPYLTPSPNQNFQTSQLVLLADLARGRALSSKILLHVFREEEKKKNKNDDVREFQCFLFQFENVPFVQIWSLEKVIK